jgi:POT family proton-dependent oligopeptide transporter
MSPLLCGYIGETYGWHKGFGLATVGMLAGLSVFVMPNRVTQLLIGATALAAAAALMFFRANNTAAILLNSFVAVCLSAAGVISIIALTKGGLPRWAGRYRFGTVPLQRVAIVVACVVVVIPVITLFVSRTIPGHQEGNY